MGRVGQNGVRQATVKVRQAYVIVLQIEIRDGQNDDGRQATVNVAAGPGTAAAAP